jgi:hypothetical protein
MFTLVIIRAKTFCIVTCKMYMKVVAEVVSKVTDALTLSS